jgi:uncharacterized protein (TIGR03000 family)
MFRRRSTTLAAALVAASLLLAPGTARAQFRYVLGGGGMFAAPNGVWGGPAGYGNPYFSSGPFGYGSAFGGFGFPFGGGFGLGFGGLGLGLGGFGSGLGWGGYGMRVGGYGSAMVGPWNAYQPLTGITGYGSYYSPLNYAALPSASAFMYPSFGGYNPAYPNYLFTDSAITAGAMPAYPNALSAFPYVPRLDMGWYASPMRTTTGYPAIGPVVMPAVNTRLSTPDNAMPRAREGLFPAVAVAPGSDLLKQKLGASGPAVAKGEQPANLEVAVPTDDAKVWFQGQLTRRTGKVRQFDSPPLAAGSSYTYEVRAQWMDGDQTVTQTQTVPVRAGERVRVVFPVKK